MKNPNRRRIDEPFAFLACTLPGWPDIGIVAAAIRAGAYGVLNLEHGPDSFPGVAGGTPARFGLKLDAADLRKSSTIIDTHGDSLALIILTSAESDRLPELIALAHRKNCIVLLEATSVEQAARGAALGVDGIVAKGNEAGGAVGEETAFVLLQRLLDEMDLPVFAHGGIALHSVAACYAAGAAGVVLDSQLLLASESTFPVPARAAVERMEGDETICVGAILGDLHRIYKRPGMTAVETLQRLENELSSDSSPESALRRWREAIASRIGWEQPESNAWLLGQDATFAAPLARKFRTVGGILKALRESAATHVAEARRLRALDRSGPLAKAHGTDYPILQGPMTRVSDTPDFAEAVVRGGGLPFLALALMRAPQVRTLLTETKERLGALPWGVGILGFVPLELRTEQLAVIKEFRPPFAIIAGGRPDQATELEKLGILTYLHIPAPSLLRIFIEDGARHFIFEGRECGGHVGPRTSFVLWDTMVTVLLEEIAKGVPAEELHIVFAGGIHDGRSAAMVAAMAAPLSAKGARIGVLMGTAYLFTEEAVRARAIVEGFQQVAIECSRTVLLESGPGHATRCAETPFYRAFLEAKRDLALQKKSLEESRDALEKLNLGRLRIASKGIAHGQTSSGDPAYLTVDAEQQRSEGMYMIGQVAAARKRVCTIAELHADVAEGCARVLDAAPELAARARAGGSSLAAPWAPPAPPGADIAIIGLGCLLPGAHDARAFWRNVLQKVDAIREIPPGRWDPQTYVNPDKTARDKIYSKWGGFLDDVPFDPMRYGIPPNALPHIDPMQLLGLECVHQALGDAGYLDREFPRDRTSVILGMSGGLGEVGMKYGVRALLPDLMGEPPEELLSQLPEWTEDSFPGLLLNVTAGRIANRFDFGGVNYAVDAACASSLAAVHLAVRELRSGSSDMVVVGGVDNSQSPFGFLCFSKSQALSAGGRCRTFDEKADGIAISEGAVMLVLKRLEDAERDGDRIYAVIKSVAGSSDGRGRSLTAPRPEGQVRALERAYAEAGVSPATVGLVEAHGTGTVAGDSAELESLAHVFGAAGAKPESCAVGSIKSMVGHTKAAAGVAGVLKAALALHHKTLPATLHVQNPNRKLKEPGSPFYVNVEPRPWISEQRRAGVSSFGFGGTNFHAVLEEYAPANGVLNPWPAELFFWSTASKEKLTAVLNELEKALENAALPALADLAAAVCANSDPAGAVRVAIVASSVDDLRTKLRAAIAGKQIPGIYLGAGAWNSKVALLFPGQGSQYPDMLRDLALSIGEVRDSIATADRVLAGKFPRPLSSYIYPPPAFSPEETERRMRELTDTAIAQPALGAVEIGLYRFLSRLGVRGDMAAGHSYGEYVALCAAGVFADDALHLISEARGRFIKDAVRETPGVMSAVGADRGSVAEAITNMPGVWLANFNAPRQTIIAGRREDVRQAEKALEERGLSTRALPVACAFHTPLMEGARARFAEFLSAQSFAALQMQVFSNSMAEPYPADVASIAEILREHLVRPVRFVEQITAMHEAGARVFIEVGPRTVTTGLTKQILADKDVLTLSLDASGRHGIAQLLDVVAQLAARGMPLKINDLFRGRAATRDLKQLLGEKKAAPGWVINGAHVRAIPGGAGVSPASRPEAAPGVSTRPVTGASGGAGVSPAVLAPQAAPTMLAADDVDAVMLQFQAMMNQFLQTQSAVMTAYMNGSHAGTAAPEGAFPGGVFPGGAGVSPASRPQASPERLPLDAMSSSVAVPSAAVREEPAAVRAVPPGNGHARSLTAELLQIVVAQTGYPPEMLDFDQGIEADLGIDSIKRVEILRTFQKTFSSDEQAKIRAVMERLTRARSLREIAETVAEALNHTGAEPGANAQRAYTVTASGS